MPDLNPAPAVNPTTTSPAGRYFCDSEFHRFWCSARQIPTTRLADHHPNRQTQLALPL